MVVLIEDGGYFIYPPGITVPRNRNRLIRVGNSQAKNVKAIN